MKEHDREEASDEARQEHAPRQGQEAPALLMADKAGDGKPVPLNAGSRAMARDPALIYQGQEARTCVGCIHESRVAIGVGWVTTCSIAKRYGKRCPQYVERPPQR